MTHTSRHSRSFTVVSLDVDDDDDDRSRSPEPVDYYEQTYCSRRLPLSLLFFCGLASLFTFYWLALGDLHPTRTAVRAISNAVQRFDLADGRDLRSDVEVLPHTFGLVSHKEPNRVFHSGGAGWHSEPGEPVAFITRDISLITQVHESARRSARCSILFTVPRDAPHNPPSSSQPPSRPIDIQLWALAASAGESDLRGLSWRTRPKRTALLADVPVRQGRTPHSIEFDCSPGQLFEFSCAGRKAGECYVEFWRERPRREGDGARQRA
ncbi:hypothetical protein OF83DRAFT_1169996 [Amylostereum chailletii]|nr:hypothetical protein OF83DRAFT_1169996 [Amylostereum chailletii]